MEETRNTVDGGRSGILDSGAVGVVFDVHPWRVRAVAGERVTGGSGWVGEVVGIFGFTVVGVVV